MLIVIWIIGIAGIGLLLMVLLCAYYNHAITTEYYTVTKKGLPEAFKDCTIVMLSDVHQQEFGAGNHRLLERIKKEHPSFIVIAGDLLVKGEEVKAEKMLTLLEELVKICPVYYAPGNHEEKLEREVEEPFKEFLEAVNKTGVTYLANSSAYIAKDNEIIKISGLHLQKKYFAKFYERVEFEEKIMVELLGEKEDIYEILIAHNPNYFPIYATWGANLVFSGHVHGGVVVLPWIGGVISTTFELFPKYDFGKFTEKDSTMILSRGLGVHTIKLRLFNKPEISVVRFR